MTTAPPTTVDRPPIRLPLLLTLGLLSAIGPFALDMYLSSFPQLVRDLDTTATGAQLTLTGCLIGLAVGQLAIGPLSDRIGRRTPLLIGAAVCVLASAAAALAPTIQVLIIARFVQGFAGAAGPVIGRAVISDLATGRAAARALTLVTLVVGVAPAIAPFTGSLFAAALGWRGLLTIVLGLAVLMLIAAALVVKETLPAELRSRRGERPPVPARVELGSRTFLLNCLTVGFAFGTMLAYIAASPFLYQNLIGVSELGYGALFAVNAVALALVSALSARLAATHSISRLISIGLGLMSAAGVAFAILVIAGAPAILLTVPLLVLVGSLGLIIGNGTALALSAVPHHSGTGSAILGASQFGLGALVSPLVGIAGDATALPLAIVMIVCLSAAAITHGIALRRGPDSATASSGV